MLRPAWTTPWLLVTALAAAVLMPGLAFAQHDGSGSGSGSGSSGSGDGSGSGTGGTGGAGGHDGTGGTGGTGGSGGSGRPDPTTPGNPTGGSVGGGPRNVRPTPIPATGRPDPRDHEPGGPVGGTHGPTITPPHGPAPSAPRGGTVRPPTGGGGPGYARQPGDLTRRAPRTDFDETWQAWWAANAHRFMIDGDFDVEPTTDRNGFLSGTGVTRIENASRMLSDAEISRRVVPTLERSLDSDDDSIAAAAAIALSKIAPRQDAPRVANLLIASLPRASSERQEKIVAALGVLGCVDSVETLRKIVDDHRDGRIAVASNGSIRDELRATAAFALGCIGDPSAAPSLEDAVRSGAKKSSKLAEIAVLSLARCGSAADRSPFLVARLRDGKLAVDVAAEVPIALAELGAESAIPDLFRELTAKGTERRIQESCVIALGRLASLRDREVVLALREKAANDGNLGTRHFALIALGEIVARGSQEPTDDSSALEQSVVQFLGQTIRDAHNKSDEPWASLALGMIGRSFLDAQRASSDVATIADALTAKLEHETNPEFASAAALSLGLFGDPSHSSALRTRLAESDQPSLIGYCALALGLAGAENARQDLESLLFDDRDPEMRGHVAWAVRLLHSTNSNPRLLEALRGERTLNSVISLAAAIGVTGDRNSVASLVSLAGDAEAWSQARAASCAALGHLLRREDAAPRADFVAGGNYRVAAITTGVAAVR